MWSDILRLLVQIFHHRTMHSVGYVRNEYVIYEKYENNMKYAFVDKLC